MARLVTQADIDTYGPGIIAEGQTPMQLNDVIFFLADVNANGNIYDKTAWTGARLGATIWIEAGVYGGLDIGIETTADVTVPTDANNPAHVHFFGGQGVILRDANSIAGRDMQIMNINHLIVDFETNSYPGLRDGWGSGRAGTFGARVEHSTIATDGMGLKIDNFTHGMKHLEVRGCELTKGSFAKLRTLIAENHLDKFIIERNLITRSAGGEGFYIGQTSAPSGDGWNSFKNFKVRNNILAFTAAEGLQLQQCADGTEIHNNVIFITGHDYRAAFQPYQDTGIQFDVIQGNVKMYNNILIGFGTSGIHLFGRDGSGQANPVLWGTGTPKIFNNAVSGAKAGHSVRIHDSYFSLPAGTPILLRGNDFVSAVRDYYDDVGTLKNYHVDVANTQYRVVLLENKFPNDGQPILNPGESNSAVANLLNTQVAQTEPEFVNHGFTGIDIHQITKWSHTYEVGKYSGQADTDVAGNVKDPSTLVDGGTTTFTLAFSGPEFVPGHKVHVTFRGDAANKQFYATVQSYSYPTLVLENISNRVGSGVSTGNTYWDIRRLIPYTAGEFVWLVANGEAIPMNLYKCLNAHEGVVGNELTRRPDNDAANWQLVQWDANGKNMYDPAYNGMPATSDFMAVAGDFRLVKGSYHHLKGRGLQCNEQRDDQTMMGWQWKEDVAGTIRDIPGAYDHQLRISDYSYLKTGRYYRFWVEKMNSANVLQPRVYSDWTQIP